MGYWIFQTLIMVQNKQSSISKNMAPTTNSNKGMTNLFSD